MHDGARRAAALGGLLVLAVLCGTAPASAADPAVKVGISSSSSDVPIFIAETKGYFRDEGLSVTTLPFGSGAKMVVPLGSGDLDVGSGSATAGLYNAAARGIGIKIVADTSSAPPRYGHNILLVRKELIENGRYKVPADLKGLRIALTAPGASSTATLNEALKTAGLKFSDITPVYLGYPDHVLALKNGGVDAGLTAEPAATQAVSMGSAVRITSDDAIDPYHQAAVILYSAAFARGRPAAAKGFMRAFLRAVRFYNGALKDGMLGGPNAEDVIAILTTHTAIRDPQVYRSISPQGCNPDGYVNLASLQKDLAFYKEQGWITGDVAVEQVVDNSFVDAALKDLGPYQPQ